MDKYSTHEATSRISLVLLAPYELSAVHWDTIKLREQEQLQHLSTVI
jgi:hypothetical protein